MDYQKFHRTNALLGLLGGAVAAVWGIVNLFLADSYAAAPYISIMIAYIIQGFRIFWLTGHEDYTQESYAESQKNSYKDNRTLYIISAVCSCVDYC